MAEFRFEKSKRQIETVISEAERFIKVVAFQLTDINVAESLLKKRKDDVDIEIITLPADSFSDVDKREDIKDLYQELRESQIKLHECVWEVGDPTLTASSQSGTIGEGGGNKWYSLHGKFIVTDTAALITSANLSERNEYEVYLSYEDKETIQQFLSQFDALKKLFIMKDSEAPGRVLSKISEKQQQEIISFYKKTGRLNIREYPRALSPEDVSLERGLHILPFEGRGRNILKEIIESAEEYIYLLSERLYDDELVAVLGEKILNSDVEVKVLTNPPSYVRQNVTKARGLFRKVAAFGGEIRGIEEIHAKCWLTDKWLAVGSPNLTKMNLGFRKKGGWRANTETLMLENSPSIIESAKKVIEGVFSKAETVLDVLGTSSSAKRSSKEYFDYFHHYSRTKAKKVFGKIRVKLSLESKKALLDIAKFASLIAKEEEKRYIEEEDVIMGAILQRLKKRSATLENLVESYWDVISKGKLSEGVTLLMQKGYINKAEDNFEINIETLLS